MCCAGAKPYVGFTVCPVTLVRPFAAADKRAPSLLRKVSSHSRQPSLASVAESALLRDAQTTTAAQKARDARAGSYQAGPSGLGRALLAAGRVGSASVSVGGPASRSASAAGKDQPQTAESSADGSETEPKLRLVVDASNASPQPSPLPSPSTATSTIAGGEGKQTRVFSTKRGDKEKEKETPKEPAKDATPRERPLQRPVAPFARSLSFSNKGSGPINYAARPKNLPRVAYLMKVCFVVAVIICLVCF